MALNAAMPAPSQPPISAQTRLLVLAPHPDDETIATGLLIQQVRAAGGEVRVLLLTAGDNNPWPQRWLERRVWIGSSARRRWGRRRHAEMLQAMARLGLSEAALQSMGWPDMGVTDVLLDPAQAAVAVLTEVVTLFQPSLIAMPSINDCHPDHASAGVLLCLATAALQPRPRLLAYLVHGHARPDQCTVVSGSAAHEANKLAAMEAHRSQMVLSGKRMRRFALRPERYADGACLPMSPSASLPWLPARWLRPWLRLSVVGPGGAQTWRWRDAPLECDPAGRFRLHSPLLWAGSPCFVRLALSFPTPWIFDRWGWCQLS